MNQLDNTIQHTSWHLMNFMMCQIIGYCFRLAFEKELADLKELVHPDSLCEIDDIKPGSIEVELNLLDALNDPGVGIMLDSILRIIECRDMLVLINNLDLDKMLFDRLAIQLAHNICDESSELPRDAGDYNTLLLVASEFYYELIYQLYLATLMFNQQNLHVINEDTGQRFGGEYPDILLEELVSDDKNVDLLYKLIIELNKDSGRLYDWYHELNNK